MVKAESQHTGTTYSRSNDSTSAVTNDSTATGRSPTTEGSTTTVTDGASFGTQPTAWNTDNGPSTDHYHTEQLCCPPPFTPFYQDFHPLAPL